MIGVFDSGLGGLSALRTLRHLSPQTDFCYFGDTAHLPYGTRTEDEIYHLTLRAVKFFSSMGVSALLCACGTVSTVALPFLPSFPFPIFGVADAAAKAAVCASESRRIGVIATDATVESGFYPRCIRCLCPRAEVLALPCSMLVPPAEYGTENGGKLKDEISSLLSPLREAKCDTLILGCTHFFLLRQWITAALPEVALIDSGAEGALAFALRASLPTEAGRVRFFVSGDPAAFDKRATTYFPEEHPRSKKIILTER